MSISNFRDNGTECVCNNGFLMSSNSKVCEDLDECAENPFVCLHGRCLNTKGMLKWFSLSWFKTQPIEQN